MFIMNDEFIIVQIDDRNNAKFGDGFHIYDILFTSLLFLVTSSSFTLLNNSNNNNNNNELSSNELLIYINETSLPLVFVYCQFWVLRLLA